MAINRYENDNVYVTKSGAKLLETNESISTIRRAVDSGLLATTEAVLSSDTRLDIIAHQRYGDSRLWWIIAAASGIGWWPQVPSGTRLVIPLDINEVGNLI